MLTTSFLIILSRTALHATLPTRGSPAPTFTTWNQKIMPIEIVRKKLCNQPATIPRIFDPGVSSLRMGYILSNGLKWVNGTEIKFMFIDHCHSWNWPYDWFPARAPKSLCRHRVEHSGCVCRVFRSAQQLAKSSDWRQYPQQTSCQSGEGLSLGSQINHGIWIRSRSCVAAFCIQKWNIPSRNPLGQRYQRSQIILSGRNIKKYREAKAEQIGRHQG